MPSEQSVRSEFESLERQSVEDLYQQLALAEPGSSSDLVAGMASVRNFRGELMSASSFASTADVSDWFREKGRRLFERLWAGVKAVVCALYGQRDQDGLKINGKDWVAALVAAVVAAAGVASPVAVLMVTIAVKLGLDTLCATGAATA